MPDLVAERETPMRKRSFFQTHVRRLPAAALTLAILLPSPAARAGESLSGIPRIVDGDTVEIGATKIRLSGIDAPETDQVCLDDTGKTWNCGIVARDELVKKAGNRVWTCQVTGTDRYARSLAACDVGGEDIQRWMVRSGLALSFVKYSHTYDTDEVTARNSRQGLWRGAFIAPWDWRSRNPRTVILGAAAVPADAQSILLSPRMTEVPVSPECAIKGNITRKGECIYHLPSSRFYNKVKMDLSKGKRWFCTVDEAEAAGCRAPMAH